MDSLLNTAFLATRSILEVRQDSTDGGSTEKSFFEKNKTMIIAAGALIPLQLIGGYFYLRHRKAKKMAAAALEDRIARLEMGMGMGDEYPKP
ncbi:hypothetical protein PVAG01_09879 [Phlyctema vagabunda]|uniref:Uncharacterized protein n=1 Tax=Phlyctema vagabunda TaxID=108571 RepID=A0ABR4P4D4_9HELO